MPYRFYPKYVPKQKKIKVYKSPIERATHLTKDEFIKLENKYIKFNYDQLIKEQKRLEKIIEDNLSIIQEQNELQNKLEIQNKEIKSIIDRFYKTFNSQNGVDKLEKSIDQIKSKLDNYRQNRKKKHEEYEKLSDLEKKGGALRTVGNNFLFLFALPVFFLTGGFQAKKTNMYEIFPETEEEKKLSRKLSNLNQEHIKKSSKTELEVSKHIENNKLLKDYQIKVFSLEKKIESLNNKIPYLEKENSKIKEAIVLIIHDLKLVKKERERTAKIAAFEDKGRRGSQEIKDQLLFSIKNKSIWKCPYCDLVSSVTDSVADHIYPIDKGGLSTPENMVLVCEDCNKKKTNLTLRAFCKKVNLDYHLVCERLEKQGKHV